MATARTAALIIGATPPIARSALRSTAWLQPVGNGRRGRRRVKLACDACGTVAAVVDENPAGARFADSDQRLVIRVGNRVYLHAQAVYCGRHGKLLARWADIIPAARAAKDGRVRTLRLRDMG